MKSLCRRFFAVETLCLILLSSFLVSCSSIEGDPALAKNNSISLSRDNLVPAITATLDVLYGHGEMPVKVSDFAVSMFEGGGLMIGPTSNKLACEGEGLGQTRSRIEAVPSQDNAFNYRFDTCLTAYEDDSNYDLLNGAVHIRNLSDDSGVCNAYSGEIFYEGLSMDRYEQGDVTYGLEEIRGRFDFEVSSADRDGDSACETRITHIIGNALSYTLNGQFVEESHFSSRESEVPELGSYSVRLDSYIQLDSMEGRFRINTIEPLTGVRGNPYPDSGEFLLIGAGVSQVWVEINSNEYEDRRALSLDLDVDPADGYREEKIYLSWCELELGDECVLEEDEMETQF